MKLSEFIPRYVEWSKGVHKDTTVAADRLALNKFADCVGADTELNEIRIIDAERFISTLRTSNLKNTSINNHLRHLKTAFSRAVKWEQVDSNPFAKTKQLPLEKKTPEHIPRNKLSTFLSSIDDYDIRMLITALISTGRKRNEILSLKWTDIDTENKTYRVTSDMSGTREFNINGAFRIVLSLMRSNLSTQLSLIKEKKRAEGWVFSRWSNPDSVTHLVKQTLIKLGFSNLNLKSFKHSFAEIYPPNGGEYRITQFDKSLFNGISIEKYLHYSSFDTTQKKLQLEELCISSTSSSNKTIVFCPEVFKIPNISFNKNLVSVMMPFKSSLNSVFDTIKEAVEDNGLICKRADDIWQSSEIIQDIFELIFNSFIVVCDLTSKNPNVFYETGIAHTLGKHVIPISQSSEGMPFDLFHHRHIFYHNNSEGRIFLKEKLANRISFLKKDIAI